MPLSKARAQLLDSAGNVVKDVDILSSAESISYVSENTIARDFRGLKKGDTFTENDNKTVKDVLDDILFPVSAPIINVFRVNNLDATNEDASSVFEQLSAISSPVVYSEIEVGSDEELTVVVRIVTTKTGQVQKKTVKLSGQSSGGIYSFTQTLNDIADDTAISIEVKGDNSGVVSNTINIKFQYPIFVGFCNSDEFLEDGIINETLCENYFSTLIRNNSTQIQKSIKSISDIYGIRLDGALYDNVELYPCLLIPNTWNRPTYIADSNMDDITGSFLFNERIFLMPLSISTARVQYTAIVCKNKYNTQLATMSDILYRFEGAPRINTGRSGIPNLTGFDVLCALPCDLRTVVDTYAQLSDILYPYEGMIVYVKEEHAFFRYLKSEDIIPWYPTNQQIYIQSIGKEPDISVGTWGDIVIDLLNGTFYQKNKNLRWETKGQLSVGNGGTPVPGPAGDAATIEIVDTITLEPGEGAKVENIGDKQNARFKFSIPKGAKGNAGNAATIEVGTVKPGKTFTITNVGDEHEAILNFTYPSFFDNVDNYIDAAYPESTVIQSIDPDFDPNESMPGNWEYVGAAIATDTSGNKTSVQLYKKVGESNGK